ncbi:voltage-dependent anion channel [Vararia minispora EC-137]|uniref:Voltage-dependent anion channel n=1 Tax=Vararia minispora EC-137 TaxID=1314806 RepID=A0ACB8Q999_9AGAM|nr:voltage-dependent anion channel [Vararia minispora EC-137]
MANFLLIGRYPTSTGPHIRFTLARRIHGWSWQAFPIGMGTGAVYLTLSGLNQRWPVFRTIETVFFFINLVLFFVNISTLTLQAILYPRQAIRLITDPTKNIFIPLFVLSIATLIIGAIKYGVSPGIIRPTVIYALFWIYVTFSLAISFPILIIWFNKPHDIRTFSPTWAFLIFPIMLVGVVAFNVLSTMDASNPRAIGVLFIGYVFQGVGFFVTMFYICIYFLRIMMTGFLDGSQANGAFVAVGPPGFTALALLNLGIRSREILTQNSLISPNAGEIWYATSVLFSLMLFGFAVFLAVFSVVPYSFKLRAHLNEILGCWALTFPNVGWIATAGALGDVLSIPGFFILQATCALVITLIWLVLSFFTLVAFRRGLIFYDREDVVAEDLEGARGSD